MSEERRQWFIAERYVLARYLWPRRTEPVGNPDKPDQTCGEWFEHAFGVSLDEYAALAKKGNHADLVAKIGGALLVEYMIGGKWYTCLAAAGETFEECEAALRKMWPEIEVVRERSNGG